MEKQLLLNMWPSREREIFLILLSNLVYYSLARDIISPAQSLAVGETLISASGSFALGFFSPKNTSNRYIGIWYNKITVQTVVWVANRQNPITSNTTSLAVSPQGILAISDYNSTVISFMGSTTISNPIAQLLDTGNFVVRDANSNSTDTFLWQSFDYPTDTLLPGMKLGWNKKTGMIHNCTSWKSASDPSLGPFTLAIDIRGGHELAQFDGSNRVWRAGIWNGLDFSGIPDMMSYGDFILKFDNNTDEIYASYQMANPSTIVRIVMNYTGYTERYIWLDSANAWNLIWSTPNGRCDLYNACGPYGKCNPTGPRVCECLHGFVPMSPADWALRYTSGGCIRNTSLACANGTDGFMKFSNVLVPDTLMAKIDASMSLDECRDHCLRNCLCTGYTNADVRNGGSGCVMWVTKINDIVKYEDAGQDLYVRLAAADLASLSSHSILAIVLNIVLGTILLVAAVCYAWRKHKQTRDNDESTKQDLELLLKKTDDIELHVFDFAAIEEATNNFSDENMLGEGGFGPVYKGKMREGQEIAVKRLSKTSGQGLEELMTEIVLVAKLQHRNLVKLLGCCIQGDERMLIYEYLPNKSLDTFLFDEKKAVLLDWNTRYRIILGIARGLLYLHQDSRFRIIHRDLKASNILLDKDMNPKISDFGLARIFGEDEMNTKTRRVVGTYGYMSPEYALNGIISVKSDVFSFGVLVLEIISCRRNKGVYLSKAEEYLLGEVWTLWQEGKGLDLVDASLDCSFSTGEALRCMKVGLLCVQERPEDRPTMSSVILMLGSDHVFLPEPKQPGFGARTSPGESSASTNGNSHSINDVTITTDIAR